MSEDVQKWLRTDEQIDELLSEPLDDAHRYSEQETRARVDSVLMRTEFEGWLETFRPAYLLRRSERDRDGYAYGFTHAQWLAWKTCWPKAYQQGLRDADNRDRKPIPKPKQ